MGEQNTQEIWTKVGELPGLERADALGLVQQLWAEGLLVCQHGKSRVTKRHHAQISTSAGADVELCLPSGKLPPKRRRRRLQKERHHRYQYCYGPKIGFR